MADTAALFPATDDRTETAASPRLAAAPIVHGKATLHSGYVIDTRTRLADLSTHEVPVFPVHQEGASEGSFCAWLAHPNLMPRYHHLRMLRQVRHAAILKPHDWHLLQWQKGCRLAIVSDTPTAPSLQPEQQHPPVKLDDRLILEKIARPISSLLIDLEKHNTTCRALCPRNLYLAPADNAPVQVSSQFTTPAGYSLPPLFESPMRALAHPAARGTGTLADDLYSLGVTILSLFTGKNWAADTPENAQLLKDRLTNGSYSALTYRISIPSSLSEMLKGLLEDNPAHRWDCNDLDMWLNGHRVPQRHGKPLKKAARAFDFQGEPYFNIPSLAAAMGMDSRHAVDAFANTNFETWLKRSVDAQEMPHDIKSAVSNAKRLDAGLQAYAATSYSIITLCPALPLFYRDAAFCIDGLGALLYHQRHDSHNRTVLMEALKARVPNFWLRTLEKIPPEYTRISKTVEKTGSYAGRITLGYGFERCLYELNPELPCQSPLLEGFLVTKPADLLPALNSIASQTIPKSLPVDRHIAAYMAANSGVATEEMLLDLNNEEKAGARELALLRLYAATDRRLGAGDYPHLTRWLGEHLPKAAKTYHHLNRRKRLIEKLAKLSQTGNLQDILAALDNQQEREHDYHGFMAAQEEYRQVFKKLCDCRDQQQQVGDTARALAVRYAPAISGCLSFLIIAFLLLVGVA